MKILRLKNRTTKIKNSMAVFNSELDTDEERTIWHFNQKQIPRLKRGRKQEENIEECEKYMGHDQKVYQRRYVSPRRENRGEAESEGRMATNFPELTTGIKPQIQNHSKLIQGECI